MRLGILELGGDTDTSALVESLRAADIDVVRGEEPLFTTGTAIGQSGRIGRADCDAVLLAMADNTPEGLVLPAILHLSCPIVVCGTGEAAERAAADLREQRIPFAFWRQAPSELSAEDLHSYLRANKKTERQPGIEAAAKLYGQRFAVPISFFTFANQHRWFGQFGVILVPEGEEAEFNASGNDPLTAFMLHLLKLITGSEPELYSAEIGISSEHTFVSLHDQDGRFVCRLASVTDTTDTRFASTTSPTVVVPGDRRVAVQAACHLLDITVRNITGNFAV